MSGLAGKRIVIVDDEPTIAMLVEDVVIDEGGLVVGPAASLEAALALARCEAIDAAVLDVNLAGPSSIPVADVLRERGIPFLFATGYGGDAGTTASHPDAPVIVKPFSLDALTAAIDALVR